MPPLLMLKNLPRYECILEATRIFPDLKPQTCEAFLHALRTADMLFTRKRNFLRRLNLSPGGFSVLMILTRGCEDGVETSASLADKAGVTRATMTGLIDTLVKDGLAVRETDPTDRRLVRITATGAGRELIEETFPRYLRFIGEIMSVLSPEEQTGLARLLQKLQAGMDAASAVPATGDASEPAGA